MGDKTATHTIMGRDQDQRDQRDQCILHNCMEAFWKRWAPDDRREAAEFQADLHNIVRQVYREAQAPVLKQLGVVASALPLWPNPPFIKPGS